MAERITYVFLFITILLHLIANEPGERRREPGEAAAS